MTDPKPYTVAEAQYNSDDKRLLATAQAAAEADSLRARLAFEHDRAERGRERAVALASLLQSARAVVEHAQQNARHLTGGDERRFAAFLADSADFGEEIAKAHAEERSEAEAALTTAQGEVAVLREALECLLGLGMPAKFAELTRHHPERREAVEAEVAAKVFAAYNFTRATADAHDERVRREALEAVHSEIKGLYEGSTGGPDYQQELQRQFRGGIGAALTVAAELLNRALTHPTKEPT